MARARGFRAQTSELFEDYFGFCVRTKDVARISRGISEVVGNNFQSRKGPWDKVVICQFFDVGNLRAGVEMVSKVRNPEERDKMTANILEHYSRASVRGVEMGERVVGVMKGMDLHPGLPVYKVLAQGYAQFEEVEKCRDVMQKMRRDRVYPDVEVYNHAITGAGRKGDLYTCLQFLDEMLREGVRPDLETFNRMILAFAQKGSTENCFKMLDRMQEEGITPDSHTFTAFWEVMTKDSNVHDLTCLMDMLIQVSAENLAKQSAGNLAAAGNSAGNSTQKLARNSAENFTGNSTKAENSVPVEVQKLGDAMRRAGETPGMNAFYRVMQALKNCSEVDLCIKLLESMNNLGMAPNLNFYNAAIAAVRARRVDKAQEIMDAIRRADLQPDQHTYTWLVRVYSRAGDATRCREALEAIRALSGTLRRDNLYTLIESFASLGETEICSELLKEALKVRGEWTVFQTTFHALFAAFARTGETQKCKELLREMRSQGVRPTLPTYTQVVRAFASKLEKDACDDVLREMAQDGVKPDKAIQLMVRDMQKQIEEREKGKGGGDKVNKNKETEGEGEMQKQIGESEKGKEGGVKVDQNKENEGEGEVQEREKGIGGEKKANHYQNEESEGERGKTKPVESAWIEELMKYEGERKENANFAR
eukprot:Phypoly_transcript_02787.p1 GENE.Phypoly_transcript_02787~~Phypoly_transcript_02787.p1  ORF type:complete len:729 (+),score=210.70 Phypoly_transcript_02787:237-2189(+)